MTTNQIMEQAVDNFGHAHQIIKAMEEMAELEKELCKILSEPTNTAARLDNIAEEIADVEIMLTQLKIIFAIPVKLEKFPPVNHPRARLMAIKIMAELQRSLCTYSLGLKTEQMLQSIEKQIRKAENMTNHLKNYFAIRTLVDDWKKLKLIRLEYRLKQKGAQA